MRKRREEHVNHERWLVSYADFITLLFAFFVVMYAVSRADLEKVKAFSDGVKRAFGGAPGSAPTGMNQGQGGNTFMDDPLGRTSMRATEASALKKLGAEMRESLSHELGPVSDPEKLEVLDEERGLVLRLSARGFYDKGTAEVRADALPVLDNMARIIKAADRFVRVEGHTDNGKASSVLYATNWELSTARAAWIVRYLVQQWQLDPHKLEVAGYAEFRPIAPNDTEAGRARNRRVEILVKNMSSNSE